MKGVESRENPGGPDETPEVADRGSSSSGSRPSSPPLERGEQGAPSPGAKQRRGGPPSGVPREGVRSAGDLSSGTNKQRQILAKAKRAFMNGSMSDAEPHFETLVDTGPFSGPKASAFIALSQIYINSGRPEQAIELLKRVPATGEEVVEVHLVRARAFGQAGNKKEAIEEYEHLIEMQPNYLFVYSSLGALYEQAGRQEKSKQLYKTYEKRLKSMFDTVTKPEQSKAIARMNTLDILALVDDKRAREAARKGLQDPEPKVRAKAAQTLYQMKATSARSDLEKVAEHDSNKRVREAARTALQRLSSKGGSPPAGGPR
jgi:tetratricopeptide (TPR) repeat protein